MDLSDGDFNLFRDYVHEICGIKITDDKKYLISQRLSPIAKKLNISNLSALYLKSKLSQDINLKDEIINAITTNETSFFRDKNPFDCFSKDILPPMVKLINERKNVHTPRRGPKVRIWCAASSTGQEPYSISMLIDDFLTKNKPYSITTGDFEIIATDISSQALSQAMLGKYNYQEVKRGVPPEWIGRYFLAEDKVWTVKEHIQSMVQFRHLNLTEPINFLGGFDCIFCRNVLIYFSLETKQNIFEQMHKMLNDDGFLILGATENIYGITDYFESVYFDQAIVYKKRINSNKPVTGE